MAVAGLKHRLSQQLEKYFVVSPIHIAATLLDHRLKDKHDLMSDALKAQGIQALWMMENRTTALPVDDHSEEPPRKRAHTTLMTQHCELII